MQPLISAEGLTKIVQSGDEPLSLAPDGTFQLVHVYADNGSYPLVATIRDRSGAAGSGTVLVQVANVAPQNLAFSGPQQRASRGQSLAFAGSFTDPGAADTFTAAIDWDDGTFVTGQITKTTGGWQINASHAYAAGGTYRVGIRVTDDDGGVATQTTTVLVTGVGLDHGVLEIVGSSQRDALNLTLSRNQLRLTGMLGVSRIGMTFAYAGLTRIVVDLADGNDTLVVDRRIRVPLVVDAGAGNDLITAGGGPAVLLGGDGNDILSGGAGRDVLIGGAGRDWLSGGANSDLLIAGTTAYDHNQAALLAVLAEWSASRPLAARSANLRSGTGPVLQGTGVMLQAGATIFDDRDVDTLLGGDLDWFFFTPKKDILKGKSSGELVN